MSPTAWGWLVLAFPLAGFLVNAFGWRVMRDRTAGWIATVAIGLAFVCAIGATVSLLGHSETNRVRAYPSRVLQDGAIDGSKLRDSGAWGYVHNDRQVIIFVVLGVAVWLTLQFLLKETLPVSSLFDRFELHDRSPPRDLQFHGEPALSRFRVLEKRAGDVQPLQAIAGQPGFPVNPGPDPCDLLPAPGETPTFDEKDVAICFPPFR